MTNAAERTSPYSMFIQSYNAVMTALMAPAGDPISPPTPRVNPKRTQASPPPKPGIVAQCGAATIISALTPDGDALVYRATFAADMIDDKIAGGCAQFFRGCNVCSVRYDGCDEKEKAACTDTACLEKACERKVVCSSKTCRQQGKAPTCESRLARTQCMKKMF